MKCNRFSMLILLILCIFDQLVLWYVRNCPFGSYLEHFTVHSTTKYEQTKTTATRKMASANEPAMAFFFFRSSIIQFRYRCCDARERVTRRLVEKTINCTSIEFIIIANFCVCARESSELRNCQLNFELIFNRNKIAMSLDGAQNPNRC